MSDDSLERRPSTARSGPPIADLVSSRTGLGLSATRGTPFDEAAHRFFEPEATAGRLEPDLVDGLRERVRRTVRTWRGRWDAAVDEDDVLQAVLEKLLVKPPDRPEARSCPAAVLLKWAGRVALNYLTDLGRRVRHAPAQTEEGGPDLPSPAPSPEMLVQAGTRLAKARLVVACHYDRGLDVFDLDCQDQLSSVEAARLLDTSANNIDKIRSRIRATLSEHWSDWSDPPRPLRDKRRQTERGIPL